MGSSTKTLRYVYDSRGNRRALIDPDGGRFTYTYDAVNRISQVQNPQGDRTSYSYDPAGRRTVKELANGTRASFTYDDDGNLTGLYNLKSDGTVVSSFDYSYDNVGNRTSVLESDASRVTWSYDNTYQLTGEHRTGTSPYRDTYTYDPVGNRLLKIHDGARTTYAYDAANQLTYSQDVSGRTTYTFDADGNQQVVRAPTGDRTTYVWDYENRMTSAQLPSGIRNTMAYDAEGLRMKLEESTGTKKFVWDDQNYLAETDENNDTQVVYTNEPRLYGNLISQRRGSDSHWYHFDAIGSTRELTNASAVITDTKLYDAWGQVIVEGGSVMCCFDFVGLSGYRVDRDTQFHYVRQRHLASAPGRWQSPDPKHFVDGPNHYRYARNTPTVAIDPSGLQSALAGTFSVRVSECDTHERSAQGNTCCCYSISVAYDESSRDSLMFDGIALGAYARTTQDFGACIVPSFWFLDQDAWHYDTPKDGQNCWSKRTPNVLARWTDFPGGGPTPGRHVSALGFCPWYCAPRSIRQEWEVCAIGLGRRGPYSTITGEVVEELVPSMIGCVIYGVECTLTYKDGGPLVPPGGFDVMCPTASRYCDVSCSHGAPWNTGSKLPASAPKYWRAWNYKRPFKYCDPPIGTPFDVVPLK